MAKKSDHRSSLETDDTGGVLGGLLAEEDNLDRRALFRLGTWGVGAVAAVVVAVMANQSSMGWKREQMATADVLQRAQQMQAIARETDRETRRLASAVETLSGDRDRLYTRVTTLESGLDSVTGAIARQNTAAPRPPAADPGPAPTVAPVVTAPAPTSDKPAPAADPASASLYPKDAARETAKAEIPKIEGRKTDAVRPEPVKPEMTKVEPTRVEPPKIEPLKVEPTKLEPVKAEVIKPELPSPATPLVASKSLMAPPDPSASKLVEPTQPLNTVTATPIPEVVAAAPATDGEAEEEAAPKIAVQRTQFGIDLGTANTVPGLRALWRGLLKSRSNALLTMLQPIIVVKEAANGGGMQLRLVAGPLNDAGAAARICAVMTENNRKCETSIYDGQRLSLAGDDPPAPPAAKPAPRRRAAPAKKRAVEEPKKPEPSTTAAISSWFGKKGQ